MRRAPLPRIPTATEANGREFACAWQGRYGGTYANACRVWQMAKEQKERFHATRHLGVDY